MQVIHVEKFPNAAGDVFNIRIIDWHNEIETAINLLINDRGEETEINIKRYQDDKDSDLNALIEKAKRTIQAMQIIRGI
jgi:hypothetical protein